MSIDGYLDRIYDRKNYNCGHFVSDVWFDLTGKDIALAISGLTAPTGKGRAVLKELRMFKRIETPESPCIVLLSPPRGETHVGIYLRGKVLHITESGVFFQHLDIVTFGFKHARFYKC